MEVASHLRHEDGDGGDLSDRSPETDSRPERLSVLLAGVAAGDRAAMAAFYDKTSALIFGLLTRMLGAGAAAEETLVEVYSCVWREAASYRSGGVSPVSWLVSTARECALRKGRPRPAGGRPREASKRFEAMNASAGGAEKIPSPVESARACEALGGLDPKQRSALQLSYFSGFSGPERVEAALGLTKAEARSLISGAVRSYSEILRGVATDSLHSE
jgi:RNA polymerase sigma-70 factor (ECF subfamily)